jgi:hypothetical protein
MPVEIPVVVLKKVISDAPNGRAIPGCVPIDCFHPAPQLQVPELIDITQCIPKPAQVYQSKYVLSDLQIAFKIKDMNTGVPKDLKLQRIRIQANIHSIHKGEMDLLKLIVHQILYGLVCHVGNIEMVLSQVSMVIFVGESSSIISSVVKPIVDVGNAFLYSSFPPATIVKPEVVGVFF